MVLELLTICGVRGMLDYTNSEFLTARVCCANIPSFERAVAYAVRLTSCRAYLAQVQLAI